MENIMNKNINYFIAKSLIQAQLASDFAKIKRVFVRNDDPKFLIERNLISCSIKEHDMRTCRFFGYTAKESYIIRAIDLIRSNKSDFRYYVSEITDDQNGYDSIITYFDFKFNGVRKQISFHTPLNSARESGLATIAGTGRKTRWNRQIGGSKEACRLLVEMFNI